MINVFKCSNSTKQTINETKLCDGIRDCQGGEDESDGKCVGSIKHRDIAMWILLGYTITGIFVFISKYNMTSEKVQIRVMVQLKSNIGF